VPETVCAVIVTHNRRELLRESLAAVLGQTRRPDHVLVVDNASTDGTREMVAAEYGGVELLALPRNEGGAGGFHAGIADAVRRRFDWIWVMDDDTIPNEDALALLLDARARLDGLPDPVLLASRVVWTDGRLHPMNTPGAYVARMDETLRAVERGLLPMRATTFPSLLVRRDAVERHGAPRKGFFIWSDDMDFTLRILRHEPGYVVPASVAVHKTKTPHQAWEGGERFYYSVRNDLFLIRGDTLRPMERISWALGLLGHVRLYLRHERFRPAALRVVLRGLRDGLLSPHPQ
jgi:rhamnopyranosyl-N-acetylglucosaminyl-diphospho-decaprenol beta-1,3/1,4-galactofuranosyltransferase